MLDIWIANGSAWADAHLATIAAAFATTLFVVYGDLLRHWLKDVVVGRSLLVRTGAFITLCAFGIPLVLALMTPMIRAVLTAFGPFWILPTTVAAFVTVGIAAERRRMI